MLIGFVVGGFEDKFFFSHCQQELFCVMCIAYFVVSISLLSSLFDMPVEVIKVVCIMSACNVLKTASILQNFQH